MLSSSPMWKVMLWWWQMPLNGRCHQVMIEMESGTEKNGLWRACLKMETLKQFLNGPWSIIETRERIHRNELIRYLSTSAALYGSRYLCFSKEIHKQKKTKKTTLSFKSSNSGSPHPSKAINSKQWIAVQKKIVINPTAKQLAFPRSLLNSGQRNWIKDLSESLQGNNEILQSSSQGRDRSVATSEQAHGDEIPPDCSS